MFFHAELLLLLIVKAILTIFKSVIYLNYEDFEDARHKF